MAWQPIETAPRHTEVLAWCPAEWRKAEICVQDDEGIWRWAGGTDVNRWVYPTLWVPLPEGNEVIVAKYDLSKRNISFDFYVWMVHAYILGAREIVFDISKGFGKHALPNHILRDRYENIIKPGPALMGLPSREGTDGVEVATHKMWGIIETKQYDFPRLKSVKPPGTAKYTITIRNVPVHLERNSGSVWREFARNIGAHIIEDYHDDPVGIHDRMALYAGAKMNFGVVNGPLALAYLSDYPMQMWNCGCCEHAWLKHGIKKGQNVPWFRPNQTLLWQQPKIKWLMHEIEKIEC